MKKLTAKQRKIIKKIIAREFLFALVGILITFILMYIWDFFIKKDGYSDSEIPLKSLAIIFTLFFPLRYIIYATKWSIDVLKD